MSSDQKSTFKLFNTLGNPKFIRFKNSAKRQTLIPGISKLLSVVLITGNFYLKTQYSFSGWLISY